MWNALNTRFDLDLQYFIFLNRREMTNVCFDSPDSSCQSKRSHICVDEVTRTPRKPKKPRKHPSPTPTQTQWGNNKRDCASFIHRDIWVIWAVFSLHVKCRHCAVIMPCSVLLKAQRARERVNAARLLRALEFPSVKNILHVSSVTRGYLHLNDASLITLTYINAFITAQIWWKVQVSLVNRTPGDYLSPEIWCNLEILLP